MALGPLAAARSSAFRLRDIEWLADRPGEEFSTTVQIRYRHKPAACTVRLSGGSAEVRMEEPQFALAPGQSAVFYDGDRVLGGGIICAGSVK